MPRKAATTNAPTNQTNAPKWTPEELMADRHLGVGMIGQEKYDAIQAYVNGTDGGRFGPALLGSKAHNQAAPIRIENGVPIFAETV